MAELSYDDALSELKRRGVDTSEFQNHEDDDENVPRETLEQNHTNESPTQGLNNSLGGPSDNLASRLGKDIFAGVAQAGQGLSNFLYSPLAKKFPNVIHPINVDYNQTLGIQNPGLIDKAIQTGAGYAPYAALGGVGPLAALGGLGRNAAIGGLYGATQGENPIAGAIGGALGGAGGHAVGESLGSLGGYLANSVAKNALAKKALGSIESLYSKKSPGISNPMGLTEDVAHEATIQEAKRLGINGKLDDKDYQKALKDKLRELQAEVKEHPLRAEQLKPAIKKLQDISKSKFGNLEEAYNFSKILNKEYKNANLTDPKEKTNIVNFAKGQLEKAIDDSISSLPKSAKKVHELRNLANALTQQRVKKELFAGKASEEGLDIPGFLNKYRRLPEQTKANLFSPEDRKHIELLDKIHLNQKLGTTHEAIKKMGIGHALETLVGSSLGGSVGRIPMIENYAIRNAAGIASTRPRNIIDYLTASLLSPSGAGIVNSLSPQQYQGNE